MEANFTEWLQLAVRWLHVITGIAWIGTSFFFNWLDSNLTPSANARPGIEGELWMVHSGGFYQVEKMQLAPDQVPPVLHWFKWEAGFTWLSGIVLLAIIYYLGAELFLIDPAVAALSPVAAIGIGIGFIVVGWLVYDALWQSPLAKNVWLAAAISFALFVGVSYGVTQLFSGRGAFIHVGVVLGTLMAANVWVRIIPAQQQLVAATKAGTPPDARLAANAKWRSLHNNYMTLPVVFIMISNHFPSTFGHAFNWAILVVLFLVGAGVRHYFNLRNKGRKGVWLLPAAVAAVVALVFVTAPRPSVPVAGTVSFAAARSVIGARCTACHSETPTHEAFPEAPGGIKFDTPEQIAALATRIHAQTVVSKAMPLGNVTEITEAERALIDQWFRQGARVE